MCGYLSVRRSRENAKQGHHKTFKGILIATAAEMIQAYSGRTSQVTWKKNKIELKFI